MHSASPSASITLRALITARWVLLGLALIASLLQTFVPQAQAWLPQRPEPGPYFAVLAVWAALNLATAYLVLRRQRANQSLAGMHLLADAIALTLLFALSGGATNPFTILYFLPITLATQVSPRWTWTLAGFSLLCFATLFFLAPEGTREHHGHFVGHLRGMWVAFAVSGALITYFVHSIALSLARQRQELAELRNRALQNRHLAALGTLAAGAAHELGTPLGTINVLVSELPHMPEEEQQEAVGTIRRELGRCKGILQRMASPELSVDALSQDRMQQPWRLAELAEELGELPPDVAVDVAMGSRAQSDTSTQPKEVLGQILRELVTNAVQACRARDEGRSTKVRIELDSDGTVGSIHIHDDGVGMDSDTLMAAFDPFFSTRTGGMGLGLYLAKAHLNQLGGDIELRSGPEGTDASAVFPLRSPVPQEARRR